MRNEPFQELQCSVCGKPFIKQPGWVYKTKYSSRKTGEVIKHQCSYSCWRKASGNKKNSKIEEQLREKKYDPNVFSEQEREWEKTLKWKEYTNELL